MSQPHYGTHADTRNNNTHNNNNNNNNKNHSSTPSAATTSHSSHFPPLETPSAASSYPPPPTASSPPLPSPSPTGTVNMSSHVPMVPSNKPASDAPQPSTPLPDHHSHPHSHPPPPHTSIPVGSWSSSATSSSSPALLSHSGDPSGILGEDGEIHPLLDPHSHSHQGHFLCGIIPLTWHKSFLKPLLCVLILVAVACFVSAFLYIYLRNRELGQFRQEVQTNCEHRANLVVQNFQFGVQTMQSMLGFFAVQQRYQYNQTGTKLLLSKDDWRLYVEQSATPTFIDQFVWLPRVLDADRLQYESDTGFPITDIDLCPNRGPNTSIPVNCTGFQFEHYRPKQPVYFPYQYFYPNFSGLPPGVDFDNIDGLFALTVQGVEADAIPTTIARNTLKFSTPQLIRTGETTALDGSQLYGVVGTLPLFERGWKHAGNYSHDIYGCQGVVAAVIRVSNVLEAATKALAATVPMNLKFYDQDFTVAGKKGAVAVATYIDPTFNDPNDNEIQQAQIYYGLRNYTLHCIPSGAYVSSNSYTTTPLLIAVGCSLLIALCIVILISGFLVYNVRRQQTRTAMLVTANLNKSMALNLLAQAKELADRANKSKSDFLAFLCHELRNPLHAIAAMVEFLSSKRNSNSNNGRMNGCGNNHDLGLGNAGLAGMTGAAITRSLECSSSLQLIGVGTGLAATSPHSNEEHSRSRSRSRGPDQEEMIHELSTSYTHTRSSAGGRRHGTMTATGSRREQQEYISVIDSQVTLMRSIIDDFLDMSKIEAGVIQFECIGFNPSALVRSLIAGLRNRVKSKNIQMRLKSVDDGHNIMPTKIYSDPTRISQLVMNLLTNAIKFTEANGRIDVELSIEPIPDDVKQDTAIRVELIGPDGTAMTGGAQGVPVGNVPPTVNLAAAADSGVVAGGGGNSVSVMSKIASAAPSGALGGIPEGSVASLASTGMPISDESLLGRQHDGILAVPSSSTTMSVRTLGVTPPSSGGRGIGADGAPLPPNGLAGNAADANSTSRGRASYQPLTNNTGTANSTPSTRYTSLGVGQNSGPTPMFGVHVASTGVPGTRHLGSTGPSFSPLMPTTTLAQKMKKQREEAAAHETVQLVGNNSSGHTSASTSPAIETRHIPRVMLKIAVTDTGVGIAPSALPHLFEPYSQEKLSIMRTHGGTGLGLAIVKNIVCHMHGSINVTSEVGLGSRFEIYLPVATAPVAPPDPIELGTDTEPGVVEKDTILEAIENISSALVHERDPIKSATESISNSHNHDHDIHPKPTSSRTLYRNAARDHTNTNTHTHTNTNTKSNSHINSHINSHSHTHSNDLTDDTHGSHQRPSTSILRTRFHEISHSEARQRQQQYLIHLSSNPHSSTTSRSGIDHICEIHGITPTHQMDDETSPEGMTQTQSQSHSRTPPTHAFFAAPHGTVTFHMQDSDGDPLKDGGISPNLIVTNLTSHSHSHSHAGTPRGDKDKSVPTPLTTAVAPAAAFTSSPASSLPPIHISSPTAAHAPSFSTSISSTASTSSTSTSLSNSTSSNGTSSPASPINLAAIQSPIVMPSFSYPPTAAIASSSSSVSVSVSPGVPVPPPSLCFLLVDDAPINLKILERMLSTEARIDGIKYKITCFIANHGQEAIDLIQHRINSQPHKPPFDVVFSDIVMPIMDGYAMARELRRMEIQYEIPSMPLVAVTANALKQDRTSCTDAGFTHVLPKPFSRADIQAVLIQVIRDWHRPRKSKRTTPNNQF